MLVAGCGGKKRPPAVATDRRAPGAAAPTARQRRRRSRTQPVDAGPDVAARRRRRRAAAEDFSVSDAEPARAARWPTSASTTTRPTLSDEARATLEKHALWLQNHRAAKVTVEGHCDERGTVEYNLALGDQRARAARDYLVEPGRGRGPAARRSPTARSGPLDPASNEAAWAQNRRAHFVVSR